MNAGLLNVGSLLLWFISWVLPIISVFYLKKKNYKRAINLVILSISLTIISTYFQILYNNHLVRKGDWVAIEDTSGGVVFSVTTLIVVTFVLNFITLLFVKFNKNKE